MRAGRCRSHAIFTVTLEQRKLLPPSTADLAAPKRSAEDSGDEEEGESDGEDDGLDDMSSFLCAKLHLVDLAGRPLGAAGEW
jgi:hypothetical protein